MFMELCKTFTIGRWTGKPPCSPMCSLHTLQSDSAFSLPLSLLLKSSLDTVLCPQGLPPSLSFPGSHFHSKTSAEGLPGDHRLSSPSLGELWLQSSEEREGRKNGARSPQQSH
jgi:hypothetical protein